MRLSGFLNLRVRLTLINHFSHSPDESRVRELLPMVAVCICRAVRAPVMSRCPAQRMEGVFPVSATARIHAC